MTRMDLPLLVFRRNIKKFFESRANALVDSNHWQRKLFLEEIKIKITLHKCDTLRASISDKIVRRNLKH